MSLGTHLCRMVVLYQVFCIPHNQLLRITIRARQDDPDPSFKLSASYSAETSEHCALALVECLTCSGGRGSTWRSDLRVNMLRERSRNMSHNICPHSQAAWDLWHVSVGSLDYNASWLLSKCI